MLKVGSFESAQRIDFRYANNNNPPSQEQLDQDNEDMTLAGESAGLPDFLPFGISPE